MSKEFSALAVAAKTRSQLSQNIIDAMLAAGEDCTSTAAYTARRTAVLRVLLAGPPGHDQAERRRSGRLAERPAGSSVSGGITGMSEFRIPSANWPERVSVSAAALDALIEEFDLARNARDNEFCVGMAEYEASQREFDGLVRNLDRKPVSPREAP